MTITKKITTYSIFTILIIAVLCIVLGSSPTLQASAARKTQYISEVIFADEGSFDLSKALLHKKGYTTDTNYQGSKRTGAIGYKYTTDPNEAITDIKVMNMKGGYSFAEYDEFIKDSRNMSEQYAGDLTEGIQKYREGVNKSWPATLFAKKMLNNFREDDSGDLLGDLLYDTNPIGASGKEILKKIFLQGNGVVLSVIKKAIAYSCLPQGDINWMQQIVNKYGSLNGNLVEFKGSAYVSKNTQGAYEILESMKVIQKNLAFYTEWFAEFGEEFGPSLDASGNPVVKTDEEAARMNEHIEQSFKGEMLSFYELATIHYSLSNYAYSDNQINYVKGNDGKTVTITNLADVVIYSDQIKVEDILPIAEVLTPLQANVMYTTGIVPFITNIDNTKDYWDKAEKELNESNTLKDVKVTSVYAGVDRTMFTEDGIAMTNEAMRQNALSPESNPFFGNIDSSLEIALLSAMAISFVGALAVGIYAGNVSKAGWGFHYIIEGSSYWNKVAVKGSIYTPGQVAKIPSSEAAAIKTNYGRGNVSFKMTMSAKVFAAAMAVLLIVSVVFLAIEISNFFSQERTRMPTAIVENVYKDKTNSYIKYDSIKQMKSGTDELAPYDYNNGKGAQWQILYSTKNKNAGNPITQISSAFSYSVPDNYKGVALFGQSAAHNLTKYDGAFIIHNVYMSFKQDANAYPTTGSAFSVGTFALSVCGGVLGGMAIGVLATWLILFMKNKKKNEADTVKVTDGETKD